MLQGGGSLLFLLDGVNSTTVTLNGTSFNDGPQLVWNADNLGDGDHQLYAVINSLSQNGNVMVDYFEYVASSLHFCHKNCVTKGFLLLGLRIRLETASILSGPGQTPRMYPKKRSLWTIPARILSSPIPLRGPVPVMTYSS